VFSTSEAYLRQLEKCLAHADSAPTSEVSELWLTLAASYRFLVDREDRLARERRQDDARFALRRGES